MNYVFEIGEYSCSKVENRQFCGCKDKKHLSRSAVVKTGKCLEEETRNNALTLTLTLFYLMEIRKLYFYHHFFVKL